jgi:hypothetical protein
MREKQTELKEYVDELRSRPNIPKTYLEDREKHLAWIGNTFERAYECASMFLRGTDSFGSPDAMKRSYLSVEASGRDPQQFCRHHLLDHSFLVKIGITEKVGVASPFCTVPIYEMTL